MSKKTNKKAPCLEKPKPQPSLPEEKDFIPKAPDPDLVYVVGK